MPISFSCKSCGKRLKAPESAAGKTSKCPQCHAPVTCPRPAPVKQIVQEPDVPEILDDDDVDPYADLDVPNPYAAPQAREEEELPREPIANKKKRKRKKATHAGYAGVWDRIAASIVDSIVFGVMAFPVTYFWLLPALKAAGANPGQPPDPALLQKFFEFEMVLFLLQGVYFAGMESSVWQATLGKMAVGAQVTDLQGYRISLPRAIARYLVKTFLSGICLIGYIMALFTEKTQTLHDKLAGTVVVK